MGSIKKLTNTQANLVEYIENEIKNGNRIISIYANGHFGFDYAIKSVGDKNKIYFFEDLIDMNEHPWYIKIIRFMLTALMLFTYIITIGNVKINVSLKIDKLLNKIKYKNSYKYLLSYTHRTNKRYKKVNKIVVLKNIDELTLCQSQKLDLLKSLIKNKNIRKAILIINNSQTELSKTSNSFQLTRSDVEILLKNYNINNIEIDDDHINLIKKFGIEIYVIFFMELQNVNENYNFKKIGIVLDTIFSNVSNLDVNEINELLSYVSIYDKYFLRTDVANIDALECTNIDSAKDLTILKEKHANLDLVKYYFSKKEFQEYYYDLYCKCLKPRPNVVYSYVLTKPFEYNSILKIYKIDREICGWNEINSFIIKAYFYSVFFGSEEQKKQVLKFLSKREMFQSTEYISAYEKFINNEKICFNDRYEKIDNSAFDSIATCMILCMLLQISKERWKDEKKSQNYCKELLNHIILNEKDIQDHNKNSTLEELILEKKYWNLYFKELFIAYALEVNNIREKTLISFKNDIYKAKNELLLDNFIKKHSLRELTRIELLGSNINDFYETENILYNLALNSKNDKISQLALINLSVFYIENCEYNNAISTLVNIENNYHGLINFDTELSINNNKIIALFLNEKINSFEALNRLHKILDEDNIDSADIDIIKNNIMAIKIMTYKNDKNMLKDMMLESKELIEQTNEFSKFYTINNLLYIYFLCDKKDEFINYSQDIRSYIPKLLVKYTNFFVNKFKYIYHHWENKKLEIVNISEPAPPMYNKILMFGGIERWFE